MPALLRPVDIGTSALAPGLYLSTLLIESNVGTTPTLRVPVSLLVPAYQRPSTRAAAPIEGASSFAK